jgi:hypothetical protein
MGSSTHSQVAPYGGCSGDHSDREMLRFQRIRAERQEMLPGATAPMVCRLGDELIVAGANGTHCRSEDGAFTWTAPSALLDMAEADRLCAAGNVDRRLLVAVRSENAMAVRASDDGGTPSARPSFLLVPLSLAVGNALRGVPPNDQGRRSRDRGTPQRAFPTSKARRFPVSE